ncbi:hypothetical protein GE09DRAFT_1172976 [Coniochaeta sp. 2T2.1]|nr:hypothetical protein GE09DRAFT_1172976 [Coniochaeta sp. 2T2.1]
MKPPDLPLEAIPAWCEQHGAEVYGIKVANVEDKGNGWVAVQDLKNAGQNGEPVRPLLTIPSDIIISIKTVMQYAPENARFHQLLHAVQFQTERQLVLLYMLMQLVLSSPHYLKEAGVAPVAWTEYIGLQPREVPIPTMWTAKERSLLQGTSLEPAVAAKMILLEREFAAIREATRDVPFWREVLDSGHISLYDWIWVDALFRSRSFELPYSGVSCVPCLDLANNRDFEIDDKGMVTPSTAYFQQDPETEAVTLLLRKGRTVAAGEEITISYGEKSAGEMLFNYGFIQWNRSGLNDMVLPLDGILEEVKDDPLLEFKLAAFNGAPVLELTVDEKGRRRWSAPFLYLLCVYEEDGLSFRTQEWRGQQSQRILWKGKDRTGMVGMFDVFINAQDVREAVRYRAVSALIQFVEKQIARIESVDSSAASLEAREEVKATSSSLRSAEKRILKDSLEGLGVEQQKLQQAESVVANTSKLM